jgi:hypothetical protein
MFQGQFLREITKQYNKILREEYPSRAKLQTSVHTKYKPSFLTNTQMT